MAARACDGRKTNTQCANALKQFTFAPAALDGQYVRIHVLTRETHPQVVLHANLQLICISKLAYSARAQCGRVAIYV